MKTPKSNPIIPFYFILLLILNIINLHGIDIDKTSHWTSIDKHTTKFKWKIINEYKAETNDYNIHRLTAQNHSKSIVLWNSFKPVKFINKVTFSNFEVFFFNDPLIRPFGNIIFGIKITKNDPPVICFMSPYSPSISLTNQLKNLRKEGEFLKGVLNIKDSESDQSININFVIYEKTQSIQFNTSNGSLPPNSP